MSCFFWLTWNPNNLLSGLMVWITKLYLSFDLAGTNHRGTDRRLQVQVTSLLISNWDKQFPLKLKRYFRLSLGLGDTLMLFIYHIVPAYTIWNLIHSSSLPAMYDLFLAYIVCPTKIWGSIRITLTCAADITCVLILGPIRLGRNNAFWELAIHNLSVLISGVPYIPVECQGNILIKHSSKEVNVVIVIVVFFCHVNMCRMETEQRDTRRFGGLMIKEMK